MSIKVDPILIALNEACIRTMYGHDGFFWVILDTVNKIYESFIDVMVDLNTGFYFMFNTTQI